MWQQRKVFTSFIVNTRINNGETGVCGEPCLLSGFIPGSRHLAVVSIVMLPIQGMANG